MADVKLNILMQAADKLSKPFGSARRSSDSLRGALSETARKVQALERTAGEIESFRRLKADARTNADALDAAQAKAQELGRALTASGGGSKKMRAEFDAARRTVNRLKQAEIDNAQSTATLRKRLTAAGVDTRDLSAAQRRLRADLDAAGRAADREGKALDRAADKAKALGRARARMDRTLQRQSSLAVTGASGMAAGGGALALGGRMAGAGIDFGETMSGVAAVARVDKTSEAFAKLKQQAEDLGASTSFSASEAGQGMTFLAMAGFKANSILAAMPGMLDLAKAGATGRGGGGGGGGGGGETADIASNILSGFGLEADQMGRVGDVLTATFTRSNVTLGMLGETMKYVAPIAKEAGTSIEDAAAMAGLLGNVGIQADQAGTALRAIHNRLAAPPKMAARALDDLGVSVADAQGNMRPMVDILAKIAKKTEGLGSAERLGAFKAIAGAEAGAGMAALVEQGGAGAITKFADVLRNSEGEASRVASQMRDNVAGDIKGLTSAFEGLNIALTGTNNGPLRDLIQSATGIVRGVRDWVKENPRLAGYIVKVAAVLAGLVFLGGSLAVAVAGLLGPFAMARFAITALGIKTGVLTGGFSLLAKGAGALGPIAARIAKGGLGLLTKGFGLLANAARMAFPLIVGGIRTVAMALVANPIGVAITAAAAVLAGAAYLIYENWTPIAEFFTGLLDGIANAFDSAVEFVLAKLDVLKAPLSWLSGALGSLFGDGGSDGDPQPARAPVARKTAPRFVSTAAAVTLAATGGTAAMAAPPSVSQSNAYHIEIHAAPGMDEAALAKEVRRQLEARDRAAASKARARLYDGEN